MNKYLIFLLLLVFTFLPVANSVSASKTFEKAFEDVKKVNSVIQTGEKLNYTIKWNGITAAKMTMQTDKVSKDNKASYRLELKLATVGLARDIFQLNNSYTAFVDPKTELPMLVERNLSQGSKIEQNTLVYDQEKHTVTIAKEKPITVVPNIHDLSSILWAIRSASLKPEVEKLAIFNSGDKKVLFSQIETGKQEELALTTKTISAREMIVKMQDEAKSFSDKYAIRVWVTNDEHRVPVLITAEPSFGKIKIELTNSEPEEDAEK